MQAPLPFVRRAQPLLSISRFSSDAMQRWNPGLPAGHPVLLSDEPDPASGPDGDPPPAAPSSAPTVGSPPL